MSTRRRFLCALGASLLTASIAAPAQSADKLYRIGFLGARSRSTPANPDIYYDGWLTAMRDLGYVEGKNLAIEWRFADGKYDRLPVLAAELAAMKLDAIVTHGLPPTLALQKATNVTPVVFAVVVDPVGNHVVSSLAHPGGNITGLSLMAEDLNAKRIEILKQLVPALSGVTVLANPGNPSHAVMLKKVEAAAKTLGVGVLPVEARIPEEIERALDRSLQGQTNGLIVPEDAYINTYLTLIAKWAGRHRMPAMSVASEFVSAGGLVSYGTNVLDFYRRAATLVDRILKGAKPADLPIEQPTKLELVINRKTAKALGLTIPPELLVLADRVIE